MSRKDHFFQTGNSSGSRTKVGVGVGAFTYFQVPCNLQLYSSAHYLNIIRIAELLSFIYFIYLFKSYSDVANNSKLRCAQKTFSYFGFNQSEHYSKSLPTS